jgi:hypothetical protein
MSYNISLNTINDLEIQKGKIEVLEENISVEEKRNRTRKITCIDLKRPHQKQERHDC